MPLRKYIEMRESYKHNSLLAVCAQAAWSLFLRRKVCRIASRQSDWLASVGKRARTLVHTKHDMRIGSRFLIVSRLSCLTRSSLQHGRCGVICLYSHYCRSSWKKVFGVIATKEGGNVASLEIKRFSHLKSVI